MGEGSLVYKDGTSMNASTPQSVNWIHKIYGLLFILIALLDLGLAVASAVPFDQSWTVLVTHLVGILGFLIVGILVMFRVRKSTTIVGLHIGTLIGFVAGSTLGILMAIGAAGPNEAALGVGLYALLPFPILLIEMIGSRPSVVAFLVLCLPYILAFLLLGGYAFWMGRYSGSARDALRCTVYVAFAVVLFTVLAGGGYSLSRIATYTLSSYANWSLLFFLPIVQLLLYALVIGGIGAWLSRVGRRARTALDIH
jgi:hypothetical protein